IYEFAGQTPLARKYTDRTATREYLKELRHLLSHEAYEQRLESDAQWHEQMAAGQKEARRKQAQGETLTPEEIRFLSYEPSTELRTFEQHLQRYGKEFFERFGTDIPAYGNYFDENYDYFYGGEGSYVLQVDEDVKSLGIPNFDKRLLDRAITLLEQGKEVEKARRILARYTLVDFPTADAWRQWYDTNRDRLFWSESGGWLFLIDSREPGSNDYRAREHRVAVKSIDAGGTDHHHPVAVAAEVIPLQEGGKMICVKINIHPGYHVYRDIGPGDAFIPTTLRIELPEGVCAAGPLTAPPGRNYHSSGTTVYEDQVVFTQTITGSAHGKARCVLTFQCCDSHICFPPQEEQWDLPL
ncbi:MAG: protein-disulfide reductase DsbD N-terminal domain-containing protein, partial [Rikenellaceae bacterium]|nr:protein-disulfide reductase DsbD N-terminal domain-containing protein [Rikenellaceae bacterium]